MAKRKKQKRRSKKPFDRKTYEKLEALLIVAQDAMMVEEYDAAITYSTMVVNHRKATKTQKSEALAFMAHIHMQQEDFSLAFNALSAAIERTPKDWTLYFNRSQAALYTSFMARSLKDIEQAALLCDDPEWQETIAERHEFISGLVAEACADRGPDFTVDDLLEQQTLFHDGFKALLDGEYALAETKLKQTIAMGDVLPQPWFNLGSVYAERKEWDSAEKAWQRALEIDPDYDFARNNLELLPDLRAGKELPKRVNVEPYKGRIENSTVYTIER